MKKVCLIIIIVLIFIALITYFVISNKSNLNAVNNQSQDDFAVIDLDKIDETKEQSFSARIEEIYNTSLVVEGLEKNDINQRGAFSFGVYEYTKLQRQNEEISFSDLSVGQTIAITYTGGVRESYPAQLEKVIRIEVLN